MSRRDGMPPSPERLASLYIAEACHELRTPVAVLNLVAGLVDKIDDIDENRVKEILFAVHRQCVHLRVLIDRYLEHGALIYGGTDTPGVEFNGAEVVAEAIDALVPLLDTDRVRQRLEDVILFGDPTRLNGIVTNLVLNAAKYSDVSAPVDVELCLGSGDVVLFVADRGIGIRPEDRELVLQPFQRARNAQEWTGGGTGLGLPIVSAHVAAFGGTLDIDERVGGGTVMTVRLPVARSVGALAAHNSGDRAEEQNDVQPQ